MPAFIGASPDEQRAMLAEIGALELWLTTVDGQHRYPLSFDLRASASSAETFENLDAYSKVVFWA